MQSKQYLTATRIGCSLVACQSSSVVYVSLPVHSHQSRGHPPESVGWRRSKPVVTQRDVKRHRTPSRGALTTLETTQRKMDGFFSHLPYKCHQNRVASVGD